MLVVVDGALLIFTRGAASAAAGPAAIGRAVAERAFSLGGAPLAPYSRAELRASLLALRGAAFAGGYGSGAALAREAERQRADELAARLEAATDQVRQLELRMAAVLRVDGGGGGGGEGAAAGSAAKPSPARLQLRCDEYQHDQDQGAASADLVDDEEDEEEEVQSPAKRTRLSPLSPADDGASAAAGLQQDQQQQQRRQEQQQPFVLHSAESFPKHALPYGGADGPEAASRPVLQHSQQQQKQQQQQQQQVQGQQIVPRKRRFATSIANLFSGGCSATATATPLPGAAKTAAVGAEQQQQQQLVLEDDEENEEGLIADVVLKIRCRPATDAPMLDVAHSEQSSEKAAAAAGPAAAVAAAAAAPSESPVAAAEGQQMEPIWRASWGPCAAALGLPMDALVAAAAAASSQPVDASTPCLPVAGLPLLAGASLASVLTSFASSGGTGSQQRLRGVPAAAGLTCIPSALGGTPVRLWCQALPQGAGYTALGPFCCGLLQRHPAATALLAACYLKSPAPSAAGSPASAATSDGSSGGGPSFILLLEEGFGGGTLQARLDSAAEAPLGWGRACRIACDVTAALAYMTSSSVFCASWALPAAVAAAGPGTAQQQQLAAAGSGLARGGSSSLPSPHTPQDSPGSGLAPSWLGLHRAGSGSAALASTAAASARLASGTLRFCPVLHACDVWLPAESGTAVPHSCDGATGAAAKVSVVGPLLMQMLPADEGEARAAAAAAASPATAAAAPAVTDSMQEGGQEASPDGAGPGGEATAVLRLATGGRGALGVLLLQLLMERGVADEAVAAAEDAYPSLVRFRVCVAVCRVIGLRAP
jgi:hypothetical protein